MIAFLWFYKIGDHIDVHIRAIKIKKHGRRVVYIVGTIFLIDYYQELINTK